MRVERSEEPDGVIIFTFTGDFDAAELPQIIERIDQHIRDGWTRLILNFKGLEFLNSSALGYLIKTQKTLREYEGDLVISEPSAFFRTTVATLGIHEIFQIYPNDVMAMEHFKGGGGEEKTDSGGVLADEWQAGSTEFHFGILEEQGAPAVGELLALFEDGVTFQYPSDPDRVKVDPDELQLGGKLRARFRVPFLEQEHQLECEVEIVMAVDVEDDPYGASMYRVRYTRIDPEDRLALADFLGPDDDDSAGVFAPLRPRS